MTKPYELHLGNCLKILAQMPEEYVDCVLCDPPYKTTPNGNSGSMGGILNTASFRQGRGGFKHNNLELDDYLPLIFRVMKQQAHGYLMCNDLNLPLFHNKIREHGFSVFKTLIWEKNAPIANPYYMNKHEYIIFFRKGGAKQINNCGTPSILKHNNPKPKKHPSEKPTPLLRTLIENSTQRGDIVLDFTMGSGSTGEACLETDRLFVGIELDPEYYHMSEKRLEQCIDDLQIEQDFMTLLFDQDDED